MLSLIYIVGFFLSMYLYSLGDRCFYYKRYKHHKLYDESDHKKLIWFSLLWFINIRRLFLEETFYFSWKVPFYHKILVEKYVK